MWPAAIHIYCNKRNKLHKKRHLRNFDKNETLPKAGYPEQSMENLFITILRAKYLTL